MRSLSILSTLVMMAMCHSLSQAAIILRLPHQPALLDPINGTIVEQMNMTNVQVNCTSTIRHAILRANESVITLQGVANNTNDECFAANVTYRPASFFTVYTKSVASIRDANHTLHRGKKCEIMVPGWSMPINATENINMTLPLTNLTSINCTFPSKKSSHHRHHHHHHPTSTTSSHHHTSTHKPTPTTTSHKPTTTTTTTTTTTHKPTTTTTTTTTHKPTKTTTTHKPTHTSGGGDDTSDWINGQVTFFTPDQGACGDWNDDSDMIVAVGPHWYGNMDSVSKYCNRKVKIEGPKGNEIVVTVKDACPECDKGHLDLSPAAFGKLGDYDTGILKVKWHFL